MPLTPEWATFFSAELAALAALTGFVVVAISINLARILSYEHLPTRAGEALIGPVGAITATSLVLIPDQPAALLGAELVAVEGCPARLVVDGVELHVRRAQQARQRGGQGGLPRPRAPDDGNPLDVSAPARSASPKFR